MTIIIS